MKKCNVGILTFHRALNYGAVFQAYALQKTLDSMGAEAEIIDYRAEFNEKRFQRKKLRDILHVRELYSVIFRNAYMTYSRKTFEGFCRKMQMSEVCTTQNELREVCSKYDRIVSGSDQVWNIACTSGDDSYFLPFLNDSQKKTSYAASIGYQKLPEQFIEQYKTWISGFSEISVREKSAVDIVRELTGREVEYVVDPTLLLEKFDWLKLADESKVPEESFVLMYLMSEDRELMRFAKKLARKENCKLLYINDRLFKLPGAVNLRDITPEQWLGLFAKASYVVTNSFHGTVFSINFNKQFFVRYIPHSIANTRIRCALEEYGLLNREIDSLDNTWCEYQTANTILAKNREHSLEFLRNRIIGV